MTLNSLACTSEAFAELSAAILASGLALRFRAHGSSMAPLIRDGDTLLVAPVDAGKLRVGDVVLFTIEPGRIVVHRVVRLHKGTGGPGATVQGDAVARPDGVIRSSQVHGRVFAIDRNGRVIDLDRGTMRVLGLLAAWRARWGPGQGSAHRLAAALLRKLPVFSEYLD